MSDIENGGDVGNDNNQYNFQNYHNDDEKDNDQNIDNDDDNGEIETDDKSSFETGREPGMPGSCPQPGAVSW